jgi:integrase/recombinase XerD
MTDLAKALDEYLTLRRALGFKLREAARQLPRFVQFIEAEKASFITIELALRWAQQDPKASSVIHSDRLAMVRRFAAWRSAQDPRTEIPPSRLLPRRYKRPAPYIYSTAEIEKIVTTAAALPSAKGLRGLTFSTIFGLLTVTGMRVGEVVALDRSDVDLTAGTLTVREGKLGKSRIVPIHATTKQILEQYAKTKDRVLPDVKEPAFFISERGRRASAWSAGADFIAVAYAIGLRAPIDGRRGRGPRLHDLRHRFAVSTLIHWYRSGADVDCEVPKLATYLGHKSPKEVYWYLQAVPELLKLATERSCRASSAGAP